ncbi:hypothetical protein GGR28_000466 [Lewinella aquimaris]|uniref:Lipoprotein n=1 Tax=Neolewinella aquimaris TaxID=1835722 RepID=A0A840E2E8_9BACT|nr:hypothetical protein [Neolewinella aquimaris]MBB4077865.1 hypothetical protein [Neolewinella aquimaris]
MIKQLLSAAALTIFLVACDNTPGSEDSGEMVDASPVTEDANVPDPDVTTNTESEIAFVRKRFDRVQEMEAAGTLRCDTLSYNCDEESGGGSFTFCYVADDLVRASHEFYLGDHGGGSETYYFDEEDLYFAHLTQSSWRFASPPDQDDGTYTVDEVNEERRYFYNGNMIDRLYKDYQVESWKESPDPSTLPNTQTGTGVSAQVSGDQMLEIARSREFDCD